MSGSAQYRPCDELGVAELVKMGQVSPAELVEGAVARTATRTPAVDAMMLTGRPI